MRAPYTETAYCEPLQSALPGQTAGELPGSMELSAVTNPGLRDGLRRSRAARVMLSLAAATGLCAATAAVEAVPASADDALVYTVEGTDVGVYARHSPRENDTERIPGQGAYDGDRVKLVCGVTNGDAVGERGNHTWHKVMDRTNGQGPFWISDHWVNTPVNWLDSTPKANALAPGERNCDDTNTDSASGQGLQPAATVQPFVSYDRRAAKEWALAHATDTPPDAGSCTWFVSQAMVKGGFPQTATWNVGLQGLTRDGLRHGTDATKITPTFLSYMQSLPYVQVELLGRLTPEHNDVPGAQPGDVIIYDWEGSDGVDHADVVTGASDSNPDYPLVSGWSEDGANAVSYSQRGWTWSEEHGMWLQAEAGHHDMQAWLVHIKTEEEVLN